MAASTSVRFLIRAEDQNGWIMGDEWQVQLGFEVTLQEIYLLIHKTRPHISEHRIIAKYRNKIIPDTKNNWNIVRLGLANDSILSVLPSRPKAWLWNHISFYHDKFLRDVAFIILTSESGRIEIEELETKIKKPQVIEQSINSFLHMFPERIFLRTDIYSGEFAPLRFCSASSIFLLKP